MSLTIDEIRSAMDLPTETVPVDEWKPGSTITVRALTAREWAIQEQETVHESRTRKNDTSLLTFKVRLIVKAAIKDDGTPLFSAADAEWLAGKCTAVIERLYDAAAKLSGIGAEPAKALEKNSDAGRSDNSPST